MKITRLCKSAESWDEGQCEAMYVADNARTMVGQGKKLDADTASQLLDFADDEEGVSLPTETVLRATALFLGAHGEADLARRIEEFVVRFEQAAE